MVALSVIVTTPPTTPTRMMTGVIRAHSAGSTRRGISRSGTRSVVG